MKSIYILFLLSTMIYAGDGWERIIDLRGQWKFTLGDKEAWADPVFDDRDWTDMFVPSAWEDEGFPGYDGYAWYRKKFQLQSNTDTKNLFLRLGRIDDVDEVYINGRLIGFSGSFPPEYFTAYHMDRNYRIPPDLFRSGQDNVISVRVFDNELAGGILHNEIGIYRKNNVLDPEIPLDGTWKFMTGDQDEWKNVEYDDQNWHQLMVPAPWEIQGFRDYDGFAWYRKSVYIPAAFRDQDLVLVLGRIDDLDQTFVNGYKVGETGPMHNTEIFNAMGDQWLQWRGYKLPEGVIRYGEENLIAVRVYDGLVQGGIYEGPIGIMTTAQYDKWRSKSQNKIEGFFERVFKN